jgi:hypothetical protein
MYLLWPVIITLILLILSMLLNINTSWMFNSIFIAVFLGFNIRYSFYTLDAWTKTWQTIIQKQLWLKIVNQDNQLISRKQARKRFLITLMILFWPLIVWGLLSTIVWLLSKSIWNTLWW